MKKDIMLPASVLLAGPTVDDDTSPNDQGEPLTRTLSQVSQPNYSPTLQKSNSTASGRFSIRSHVSVHAIGTIPYGQLTIHEHSDPNGTTERGMIDSITEETPDSRPTPACLTTGDIFRVLDFPDHFVVGHDSIAMTTRDSLQGFRDIPPGVHFLWVQKPTPSPRCGYWYITKSPGVVRVKQWDKFNEVLGDAASQYEVREQEANIESIYPSLQPYHLTGSGMSSSSSTRPDLNIIPDPAFMTDPKAMWEQLTDAISAPFLDRVTGRKHVNEWLVDSMDCVKGDSKYPGSRQTTTSEAYRTIVGSEFSFLFVQDFRDLRILEQQYQSSPDISARVLTRLNTITEQDIVAELQFTFITGTHLGNTPCLGQWWKLVLTIILRSFYLARERPELCRSLLSTLHAQLVYTETCVGTLTGDEPAPAGVQGPSDDRLLFHALRNSKALLHDALVDYKRKMNSCLLALGNGISPEQAAAGHAFEALETWLWKQNWDLRLRADPNGVPRFGDDDDDDHDEDNMPVVVHLDENGNQLGLVSFRD